MSELSGYSEQISEVFYDWLWGEFISSAEGHNRYLDARAKTPEEARKKFDDFRKRLALPYDDDNNWAAQKDKSHQQQRVPVWADLFESTSDSHQNADYYAAQAMFAPLMTASGSYRTQCYLESANPTEYLALRSKVTGIDIEEAIAERLHERSVRRDFSAAKISFDGLRRQFDYAYTQTEVYFRGMSARLGKDIKEYNAGSLSDEAMKKSQRLHIKLATDCVIMAAKLRRGELEAVPFLEPISITDQSGSAYYPLRKRVNWLEVLAA